MTEPNLPVVSLIGQSSRTRHLRDLVQRLGRSRWPVLILGETGTGKEVIARSIHAVRAETPFVTIDCSALVAPLMESELFGHVKGAFTGAAGHKTGLIEMAQGGTAFLDEIGELPLDMQSKLLRVLQEKEYRPVGALSPKKSDFRIIAATNRDLAAEVEKGTFRRDLFYRLNVVTVRLAPLRERKDDILLLTDHFLQRYGRNHSITQEVKDALQAYHWPGNVRELENCVQHMVALNSGPLLHTMDLPSSLQLRQVRERGQAMAIGAAAGAPAPVFAAAPVPAPLAHGAVVPLEQLERKAILDAMQHTRGDRTTAALMLGIGRTTLYRKLKEYGVE